MKQLYTLILPALLVCTMAGLAQDFTTRVSATSIGKKDVLQVEYIVENMEVQDFVLPVYNGFTIVAGPNYSSNRVQSGNMVRQQVLYSLTLQPEATGRLVVPGARATIGKKTRISNSVAVEVKNVDHVQGSAPAAPIQPNSPLLDEFLPREEPEANEEQVLRKGENARDKINNNLFVALSVNKKSAFVGEPVLVTYKLCTRIRSQSRVVKQPAFSGATVIEMTADEPLPQREKIGDRWYNVYIIRQVQLIPLQPGTLQLPQASVENRVSFYREGQVNYRDLFYNNPGAKPEEITVTFSNQPQQLEVKPLPAPVPDNFSGAVGNFGIHISQTGNNASDPDANTLQVVVDGTGNLQPARAPQVAWPQGVEGFEPKEKDDIDKTVYPSNVVKSFLYPFVAARAGAYTIPPVAFVYFDPAQNRYVTIATQPFALQATKTTRSMAPKPIAGASSDFDLRLYILIGICLVAVAAGLIWTGRRPAKPLHQQPANAPAAPPQAAPDTSEYILNIRDLEPGTNGPAFYKLLHRHISGWLAARYGQQAASLQHLVDTLPHDHALQLQKLQRVLGNCNTGMYTPMYHVEDATQDRLLALEAINHLEKLG